MRQFLIRLVLPTCFCLILLLAAALVAASIPEAARRFYLTHLSPMDWLILAVGAVLFCVQVILTWQALQWRGTRFNESPDRWLTSLAQAAEWFPMLGLIGTVAGILQTFSRITGRVPQEEIIRLYAPAITATGSGLFMALVNILPAWMALFGREVIAALGGGQAPAPGEIQP